MLSSFLVWITYGSILINANVLQYEPSPDDIPPLDFYDINNELEEQERAAKANILCPSMEGCMNHCPLGHVEDERECPICEECKINGKFESDINIDERSYNYFTGLYGVGCEKEKRGAQNNERLRWQKTGRTVIIGYTFDSSITSSKQDNIRAALQQYNSNTCIRFVPRSSQSDYIRFVGTNGCSSYVGKVGGRQDVSLGKGCDRKQGTIIHELMHTLGFWHEHSRNDRDDYITIKWDNIIPDAKRNFDKQVRDWDPLGSPYDTTSVMHYGGYYFSKSYRDKPTIVDKNNNPIEAQRDGFSVEDIRQINRMYQCDGYDGYNSSPSPTEHAVVTSSNCVDLQPRENCERWKSQGFCRIPGYYQENCVKTCTNCRGVTATPVTTTRRTTTTTRQITTNAGSCFDKSRHCKDWRKQNYCYTQHVDYMRKNCQRSCGYCSVQVTTTTNPTTRTTIRPTATRTTTTRQTTTAAPAGGRCKDNFESSCPSWARSDYCVTGTFVSFMKKNCKKSCRLCGVIPTTTTTTTTAPTTADSTCFDKSEHCSDWTTQNYCHQEHVNYMKSNCRKACGFCGKSTISARVFTTQPQVTYNGQECGTISARFQDVLTQRVVGGSEALYGSIPWMVSLRRFNDHDFCGGALINNQYVVSAAHCFYKNGHQIIFARNMFAFLGKHRNKGSETDVGQIRVTFSSLVIHPQYVDATSEYDIAVLKLSSPVEFTNYVRPVCLPNQGEKPSPGTRAVVAGWGATRNPNRPPTTLHKAVLEVIDNQECNRWLGSNEVSSNMFCAGYESGGIDACQGDSGGPLTIQRGNTRILAGVVSWGYGCALRRRPGVYTQVAGVVDWINSAMN